MPFPFVHSLNGTIGQQLSAGNVGCTSIAGGSGSAATYVAGPLDVPEAAAAHALFTSTRYMVNDLSAPGLVDEIITWSADVDPPSDCIVWQTETGGKNHPRSGWKVRSNGEIELIGGGNPDASPTRSKKQYSDGRTWTCRHLHDAANSRQWLFIFDRVGNREEILTASIDNLSGLDKCRAGIVTDGVTWNLRLARWRGGTTQTHWKPRLQRVRAGSFTHDRQEFTCEAWGVTGVRIRTAGSGLDTARVSDAVAPDFFGNVTLAIAGLPTPGAPYTHTIEIESAA